MRLQVLEDNLFQFVFQQPVIGWVSMSLLRGRYELALVTQRYQWVYLVAIDGRLLSDGEPQPMASVSSFRWQLRCGLSARACLVMMTTHDEAQLLPCDSGLRTGVKKPAPRPWKWNLDSLELWTDS